jgi:hypothetical protein
VRLYGIEASENRLSYSARVQQECRALPARMTMDDIALRPHALSDSWK